MVAASARRRPSVIRLVILTHVQITEQVFADVVACGGQPLARISRKPLVIEHFSLSELLHLPGSVAGVFKPRRHRERSTCPVMTICSASPRCTPIRMAILLVANVAPDGRALAVFCYKRSHLLRTSRCDRVELPARKLINFGGRVGSTLYRGARGKLAIRSVCMAGAEAIRLDRPHSWPSRSWMSSWQGCPRRRRGSDGSKSRSASRAFNRRRPCRRRAMALRLPAQLRQTSGTARCRPRSALLRRLCRTAQRRHHAHDCRALANSGGIQSSWASSSMMKRGQFSRQLQAPQDGTNGLPPQSLPAILTFGASRPVPRWRARSKSRRSGSSRPVDGVRGHARDRCGSCGNARLAPGGGQACCPRDSRPRSARSSRSLSRPPPAVDSSASSCAHY